MPPDILSSIKEHLPWYAWVIAWSATHIAHWFVTKFVGGIIAPTIELPDTTTIAYRQWFRWLNLIAGNPARAALWRRGLKVTDDE